MALRTALAAPPAIAAALLVAAPAPAQTAAELFAEGAAAHDEGDLERARAKYAASFALHQAPETAANLGVVEGRLGRHREAAEHLAFALARYRDRDDETRRSRIVDELSRVLGYVGELRVEAPEGARVLVDGAPVGTAPIVLPVYVDPGLHRVEARLDGRDLGSVAITARAGEASEVRLGPRRAGAPDAPASPRFDLAPPRYVGVAEPSRVDPVLVVGGLGLAAAGGALGAALAVASDGEGGALGASIASFAMGGAALAATGIYVIVVASDGGRAGAAHLRVGPAATPGGGGLAAAARF